MPTFSATSLAKLSTCDIRLQKIFNEVIKVIDCTVLEGHRNQADQEAAFAAGNTKLHYPAGKHNAVPSRAIDVAPFPVDWTDTKRFAFLAGYAFRVAESMGIKLRWGGDWDGDYITKDQEFNDLPHFELVD